MKLENGKYTWEISARMHMEDHSNMSEMELKHYTDRCSRHRVQMADVLNKNMGDFDILSLDEIIDLVFKNSGEYEGVESPSELSADEVEFLHSLAEGIHKEAVHVKERINSRL